MLKEFREFAVRGNVVDLAVGVIIGAAFGAIVKSLVEDILTPLIAWIIGQPDFSGLAAGPVMYGRFINAVIGFLLIALVVFFVIVKPTNALMKRVRRQEEVTPPAPSVQEKLLTEIRDALVAARAPEQQRVPEQQRGAPDDLVNKDRPIER